MLPGGFGTMDELFEVLTLVQTGKLKDFPVVLMGQEFYAPGIAMIRQMATQKTIDPHDLGRFMVSDDPAAVVAYVTDVVTKRFKLSYGDTPGGPTRRWWLRE